ncbi:hypothetical protein [Synechococcus sp. PCC 7336]|uniref:T3SS (YopN, CesT) and YbjN peptide-binding chaperone 1 n=1 Tax=Synechococcus sp. PCC 7336 TaxID=195250 RepID=UPI00034B9A35|nr:hypothetical protein [Synechococcus sp. PCC 7336]
MSELAIAFANSTQASTYRKVADYLFNSRLFLGAMRAVRDRPKFDLLYESTMVEVEVLPWEVHPWEDSEMAIVRAASCVTIGSSMDADLMQYLLHENRRMRFGAFHLDESKNVVFAESVLGGENMALVELQTCILSVATIADTYDDIIAEKFGGLRAIDRASVPL